MISQTKFQYVYATLLTLLLVGMVAGLAARPSPGAAAEPDKQTVRILTIGDSITYGYLSIMANSIESAGRDGNYPKAYTGTVVASLDRASYRLPLYQMFTKPESPYEFDFVGKVYTDAEKPYSFTDYPVDKPGYPRPPNPKEDLAFVGWYGYTTAKINSNATSAGLNGIIGNIEAPHVALIHLGTNDINKAVSLDKTKEALTGILKTLKNKNSDMNIYIAQIIPAGYNGRYCDDVSTTDEVPNNPFPTKDWRTFAAKCDKFCYDWGCESATARFNREIAQWCGVSDYIFVDHVDNCTFSNNPDKELQGYKNIYLVNLAAGFDIENWLIPADEVHPTRHGECQIALRWYYALHATKYPNLPGIPASFCREYKEGYAENKGHTRRITTNSSQQPNLHAPLLSANGKYVAYLSDATDLDSQCSNGEYHTYVLDLATGKSTCVSVSSGPQSVQANSTTTDPAISADGNFIAFSSTATNLSNECNNGKYHVYVHDRITNTTSCISVNAAREQGNQDSRFPTISGDGNRIAFDTTATNLVTNDTNNAHDVFVRDRTANTITRVSVSSDNKQSNGSSYWSMISGDGQTVVFMSYASNLVANDTNNVEDVFIHRAGKTTRVSVTSSSEQANDFSSYPSISENGTVIGFYSQATNLVNCDTNNEGDIFVHDTKTGQTVRVSIDSAGIEGNLESGAGNYISGNGRYVAFDSLANNLYANDTSYDLTDVFVHDLVTRETWRASIDPNGNEMGKVAAGPTLSYDGSLVAFSHFEHSREKPYATGWREGAAVTNQFVEYYIRDLAPPTTVFLPLTNSSAASNNAPPPAPANPAPDTYSYDRPLDITLGWSAVNDPDGDAVTYDVTFEAGNPRPGTVLCRRTAAPTCRPGALLPATTYYWQVVATDEHGAANAGPVWQFTTARVIRGIDYAVRPFGAGGWYTGIYLADMNGDGRPEILIGNRNTSSLEIWQYDDAGDTLALIDTISFPYHIHDIKAADFDNDGDMDIVAGLRSEGLFYAANTGAPGTIGNWDVRQLDFNYAWQVLVEDFDSDGHLDIMDAIDYGPILMFYGDGKGNFAPGNSVFDLETEMRQPGGFNAVDLNGDARLDLIGLDAVYLRAFLNPGDRVSNWPSIGPTTAFGDTVNHPIRPHISPSAGDLDGNGVIDQVAFWSNFPDGPFEAVIFKGSRPGGTLQWERTVLETIPGAGSAEHAGVADLNGDGYLDIHLGGAAMFNGLRVYLGDGRGEFLPAHLSLDHGVGGMNGLAVGDLNSDGVPDIVTSRYTSSQGSNAGFEVLFGQK